MPDTERPIPPNEDLDWVILPNAEGKYPDNQVTHAILKDIRSDLHSIRSMLKFFTILAIISIIASFISLLAHL